MAFDTCSLCSKEKYNGLVCNFCGAKLVATDIKVHMHGTAPDYTVRGKKCPNGCHSGYHPLGGCVHDTCTPRGRGVSPL